MTEKHPKVKQGQEEIMALERGYLGRLRMSISMDEAKAYSYSLHYSPSTCPCAAGTQKEYTLPHIMCMTGQTQKNKIRQPNMPRL